MKTYKDIIGALEYYQVNPDIIPDVATILLEKNRLIGITGKMGSGKDTTAAALMPLLSDLENTHIYFSAALKQEVSAAIADIHKHIDSQSRQGLYRIISANHRLNIVDTHYIVDILAEEIKKTGKPVDGWERSAVTRRVLQYWGTEIRRKEDEDYWVKKSVQSIAEKLVSTDGAIVVTCAVYVTDARFSNEARAIIDLGGSLIRLEVSPEEQSKRIFARDGILPTEEARQHPSETSLDNYEGFDVKIDTDAVGNEHDVARLIAQELLKVEK
jgi:hypothetical protein